MNLKIKSLLFYTLFFCYSSLYAQISNHHYKRKLSSPSALWHQVVLPEVIFNNINTDFSDLRILGFNSANDTTEVPYILSIPSKTHSTKEVNFILINVSKNNTGHFWTFETPTDNIINEINLHFENTNFDWNIHLEGSNTQNEWFTILDKYRILAINNNEIDFNYTTINFPKANYNYYRISIKSNEVPILKKATLSLHSIEKIAMHHCAIKKMAQNNNNTTTEIDIEFHYKYPINTLHLVVSDTLDFYRPIIIKQLKDSVKTEKGWIYNYTPLTSGIISSEKVNEFHFNPTFLKQLKIIIYNHDNTPLTIDSLAAEGFVYTLIARFRDIASNYFLYYGNTSAAAPSYDIVNFKDKIPTDLTRLKLHEEEKLIHENEQVNQPLFANSRWLWVIIILLILFLSWASLKMLKSK